MFPENPLAPRAQGVRATDIASHTLGAPVDDLSPPLICAETEVKKREFWAIRLRALARDGRTLLTLSCAHTPGEEHEMIIIRHWDLSSQTRFGKKPHPHIVTSVLAAFCKSFAPPYINKPGSVCAHCVYARTQVRRYYTFGGKYSAMSTGKKGGRPGL